MNSYEIEITDLGDVVNMNEIQEALYAAGITDAGDPEVGMYLQDRHPHSVFVDPSEVTAAVVVINELGFTTDENHIAEERTVDDFGLEDGPTLDGQPYDII